MSAWDLTNVINEECNEVSTSFIKRPEDISISFDQINITTVHASDTTTSLLNQTYLTDIHPTERPNLGGNSILLSATTVDPDTQGTDNTMHTSNNPIDSQYAKIIHLSVCSNTKVEWITTTINYATEEYAIHFPETNIDPEIVEDFPSLSSIWPSIFIGKQMTNGNPLNRIRFGNYEEHTPIDALK